MATENIKAVLAELSRELEHVEGVDPDVRETIEKLHRQVEALEASERSSDRSFGQSAADSMLDHVKELESKFAASHPVLERAARELVDAIVKMGI